jgi:hypothetical protein
MYRVFLSYNTTPEDMVIVWRLQTLSAASGLHLDVPNPQLRSDQNIIYQMIQQADSVIALLTKRANKQVEHEISVALNLSKRVIPIIEPGVLTPPVKALLQKSGSQVFELNRQKPWEMEARLSEFLQREKVNKEARSALLALAGTFVGLFLLNELSKS